MHTSIFAAKNLGGSLFSSLGVFIFEVLVFETSDIFKSAGEYSC